MKILIGSLLCFTLVVGCKPKEEASIQDMGQMPGPVIEDPFNLCEWERLLPGLRCPCREYRRERRNR